MKQKFIPGLLACFGLGAAFSPAQAAPAKPNVVVILADDLGNADLGYRGSDIKTPHIDRLARGGVRLESFYGQPVCTPARAALMTGRYPIRHGLQTLVIFPSHTYGLPTDERTLPQALKEAGYETAMVGKWHLGHADRKYWPLNRGFDTQVGRIVAALEKKHMRENTLLVFSSDNGGATSALFATGARSEAEHKQSGGVALGAKPPASNGNFRGGKGTLHEGGVRVPTVVNWPAKLKPAVVNQPLHMVDIMPTVLALAGAKGSPDHPFDGKDIWPTLSAAKSSPHEDILINAEPFRGAIRKGDWKLLKIALLPGKTELFNLVTDPGETTNVADRHPDIVRDLESRLLKYATEMKPSLWIKAQPAFLGAQVRTILDPDFDIDDAGLPHEKSTLPR